MPKRTSFRLAFVALSVLGFANLGLSVESSIYRADKKVYLLGEYGSAVVPIRTTGVTAGIQLKEDAALEFNYAQGMKDVSYAEMYAKLLSVHLKKFWTNSFYTNAGVAYREVMDRTTDKVSEDFYIERRGRSYGLDFAVGNRWQFDSVSVGCDWFGWFQPLENEREESFVMSSSFGAAGPESGHHASAEEGEEGGGAHHGSSFDKHRGDWDRLSKHGTLQLFRLSAGVAF